MQKVLEISIVNQRQSNWCWVACAVMVLRYYGYSSVKKSDLSNWQFKNKKNSNNSKTKNSNERCKWKDVARIFSSWGIHSNFKSGKVSFQKIVFEIDNNRPVELGFRGVFGSGHVVLVIGYEDSIRKGNKLYLMDPNQGGSWRAYKDLIVSIELGEWVYSWTNISKK